MTGRVRVGCRLLYAVAAIAVTYGAFYLLTPALLPYHQRYVGLPERPLDPAAHSLILLIYRGVGSAMISTGLTLTLMVKWLVVQGDWRGRWLIAVMMGTTLVPMVIIARNVGPYTPWWGIAALAAIVGIALALTRPPVVEDV